MNIARTEGLLKSINFHPLILESQKSFLKTFHCCVIAISQITMSFPLCNMRCQLLTILQYISLPVLDLVSLLMTTRGKRKQFLHWEAHSLAWSYRELWWSLICVAIIFIFSADSQRDDSNYKTNILLHVEIGLDNVFYNYSNLKVQI